MQSLEAFKEINFTNIKLNKDTIAVYAVRKAILKAIDNQKNVFSGKLLDIGCGVMPYKNIIYKNNPKLTSYTGLDLQDSNFHDTQIADVQWDGTNIPFAENEFDCMLATEVLEHCFEPIETLKEMHRVLKPNGNLFFTVPFIWPLHEVPYDAYRYTPYSLKLILEKAGFSNIQIHPLGGWNTALAQMLGLYFSENRLSRNKQKIGTYLALKIIPYLLKRESKNLTFGHHFMPSGLYGWAQKQ